MKLTVVGCSGTFPGPEAACSSYLVEQDGFRLLLDAGNGSTGALQRHIDFLDLDAVVISHMHGDHYLDLITYTYARRYHPEGFPGCLPVYGPSDLEAHIAGAFGRPVHDLLHSVYDFHSVAGSERMSIGPFEIDFAMVNHPVETYAMRLNAGGRSLCYSADSGLSDSLVKLAKSSDLFLCEASYLEGEDNPPDIHLTGREAADHALRAEVDRLVLTHLVPWGDRDRTLAEATRIFTGNVLVADAGAVYEV